MRIPISHDYSDNHDWIFEADTQSQGTQVILQIENQAKRQAKDVFDDYTSDDDYGFSKTIVPVRLAQYSDELLVSRSQAKRLLARVDRFKVVIFDFEGINSIGQSFADEIFRVFHQQHKAIALLTAHTNDDIQKMISRAQAGYS